MSENKHTPGPWSVDRHGWRVFANIEDPKNFSHICSTGTNPCTRNEQNKANARLIAAAPDLLEALKQFCNELDPSCEHSTPMPDLCRFCMAKAALAKAGRP